jgi:hypothetical protein
MGDTKRGRERQGENKECQRRVREIERARDLVTDDEESLRTA